MASSRLEKIGTIYTRLTGLLRSGAMKLEDTPIWYNVYKAFPPQYEPKYDRPIPNVPVKNIFYPEDEARAWFHKRNANIGTINLNDFKMQTATQKFLGACNALAEEGNLTQQEIYDAALEKITADGMLARERWSILQEENKEPAKSLATSFQEAQKAKTNSSSSFSVREIFKE